MIRALRVFCVGVLAGGIAIVAPNARAGDSWNMLAADVQERSREASAKLFAAASRVFQGLSYIELRNYPSAAEQMTGAKSLLYAASKELEQLSKERAAFEKIDPNRVAESDAEKLAQWFSQATGKDMNFEGLFSLTISDLLSAAASEARLIADALDEAYGNVRASNPALAERSMQLVVDYMIAGTIATRCFGTKD